MVLPLRNLLHLQVLFYIILFETDIATCNRYIVIIYNDTIATNNNSDIIIYRDPYILQ